MTVPISTSSSLSTYHVEQMERLSSDFFDEGDGPRAVERRTAAVDGIVRGRFEEIFARYGGGVTAIAVGGYGRREMFPYSDVDLLLLFRRARDAERHKDRISTLLATLWDSKLRVSHSVRDPRDCTTLAPDNTELHISLLDARFLAGDRAFYDEFRTKTLPAFYLREQKALVRSLAASARRRHSDFDGTIYHLEPNVKEGPGGLRDYHLACWVAQLENVSPREIPRSEQYLPKRREWDVRPAKRLLFAVRCYLHFYYGRDKNLLSFKMQDTVAHAGRGIVYSGDAGASDFMREFYRGTRAIHRLAMRLVEEAVVPSSSLLRFFRRRKSRLANRFFSVNRGHVYFKNSRALSTRPELAMALFEFQARHGLPIASQTEERVRTYLPAIRSHFDSTATHWPGLRAILELPHAYLALEAMRESGVLYSLIPAFAEIDCLVIRDFYHRFTVDEHTLVTIRVLKDLPRASDPIDQRYADLLREIDRPDLLYCALLFHDMGKADDGPAHHVASAELAAESMTRLGLTDSQDRDTVLYLVREHLAMSEVMTKRDLSEPAVTEGFKARVKTVERLRLLTLMTYADSVAVNPSAVTNWRKLLLWQLYLGVHEVFQRDHEDKRILPGVEESVLDLAGSQEERSHMRRFVQGLPERYLRTHTGEEIQAHAQLAATVGPGEAVVASNRNHGEMEMVVLAWDRPFLFASLCAAIASCAFNIEHAEAFANDDGLVVDTFRVSSPPRAPKGELDPRDLERFEDRLRRVAEGSLDPRNLPFRATSPTYRRHKAEPTSVSFDNETSKRATIFYVRTADRTGLLYDLASAFSLHECDIDVVLCHTQGHRVSDVFYVRLAGQKLPPETCAIMREELLEACDQHSLA